MANARLVQILGILLLLLRGVMATPDYPVRSEGFSSRACDSGQQATEFVPDDVTRALAKYLKSEEVQFLAFGGDELVGAHHGESINVDDPILISRFVVALKNAVQPDSPRSPTGEILIVGDNGPSPYYNACVDIYLKPTAHSLVSLPGFASLEKAYLLSANHEYGKNARGEYLRFAFFSHYPEGCFGPRFFSGLRALGKYQVEQIRHTAREIKGKVVAFRCITEMEDTQGKEGRITNPAEVASFVDALSQVDERAYQWLTKWDSKRRTDNAPVMPLTELELRDGKKISIILLLNQLNSNAKKNPEWLQVLHKTLH